MTEAWEGYLNWHGFERRSDRYGTVLLTADLETWEPLAMVDAPAGERRRLVAEVIETVPSAHIGDFFRRIFPPKDGTPVGTTVVLGEGTVFVEEGGKHLGLCPDDDRASDWLDPHALYRVHEHRVRLRLEPM